MKFEPTLSRRFSRYICDFLLDDGIDPEPILKECGLTTSVKQEYDAPLSISTVARLFELSGQRTQNPHIGLKLAQRYHYESAGLIILTVLAAPTAEMGIKALCHYVKYTDSAIETEFKIGPHESVFSISLISPLYKGIRHLAEFLLAFWINILYKGTRVFNVMT